jgi:CheY-like chemotaxis protein
MDLHMPVMDGAEAAQRIRMLDDADAASVPIVTLSADVFPETRERCRAAGMNDFLSKPVSLRQLATLLHGMFGAPLPGSAPAMSAAPNDTPAAAELIDASVIAGVLALMTRERLQALLETFFADAQAAGTRMRAALADGLREPVRQAAHSVKGAALNLGLVALGDAAQQVQQGAQSAEQGDIERLLHRFEEMLAASRGSLQRTGLL